MLDVERIPMRAALVLMALMVTAMNGQESLERLRIEPYGTARSRVVTLEAGNIVRVASDREGELNPAIFIFESTEGLVAKNDEDSDAEGFEWTAPRAGQYRLVIYSRSSHPLEYQITRFPHEPTRGPVEGKPSLAIMPVFYATNRTLLSSSPVRFGSDPTSEGELRFGKVEVSIPLDHRMGNLEYPTFLRVLDPAKHFVARPAVQMNKSDFYAELAALASRSDEHDCLVFVHGFNVSFDDASLRVAQLAYDLGFKGPAVLFTWPSQGKLLDYLKDGRNADLSAGLSRISSWPCGRRLRCAAFTSLRTAWVTACWLQPLQSWGLRSPTSERLLSWLPTSTRLFLKIWQRNLQRGLARLRCMRRHRITALAASEHFAGYTRAGQGGKNMVVTPGIESIDASAVDTSAIGSAIPITETAVKSSPTYIGFSVDNGRSALCLEAFT